MRKKIDSEANAILEGDISKTLLKLSFPLIVSDIVEVIYNFTDTLWLSWLGKSDVSAPTVSWPPVYLLISFGAGILSAGIATVSQPFGAGDVSKARKNAGTLFIFTLIFSLLVSIPPAFFSMQILKLMDVPPDVLNLADIYFKTMLYATPLAYIGITFTTISSALGDVKLTMKINLFSTVINAVLDPFLIFGIGPFPMLGVFGAALATLIARLVVAAYSVYTLFIGYDKLKLKVEDLKIEWKWIKDTLRVGVPLGIHRSSNSLGQTVLVSFLASYGSSVLAAFGITMRIIDFIQSVTSGFGRATAIMVGMNIGRKNHSRAIEISKKSLKLLTFMLLIFGATLVLLGEQLLRVFTSDQSVLAYATPLLYYSAVTLPFFGWFFVTYGVANGSGETYFFGILSVLRIWLFRILPIIIAISAFNANPNEIWIILSLSNVISGAIGIWWVLKNKWIKKI